MLQWIAASKAGRSVLYFTFADKGANGLLHTALSITSGHVRINEMWNALTTYSTAIGTGKSPIPPTAVIPVPRKPSLQRPGSTGAAAAAGKGKPDDKPAAAARATSKDTASAAAGGGAAPSPTAEDGKAATDVEAGPPPEGELSIEEQEAAISAAYEEELAAVGDAPTPDSPRAAADAKAPPPAAAAAAASNKFPTVFEYVRYRFANRTTGPRLTEAGSIEFATGSGSASGAAAGSTDSVEIVESAAPTSGGHTKPK